MSDQNTQAWADRVKQDLATTPTKELKEVGGSFPKVDIFYQYEPPKPKAPPSARQLMPGTVILGTYRGSFTAKKYGTIYHKIQTENGLVALAGSPKGAGQLNKRMGQVVEGAEVKIVYNGKKVIEKGQFAGQESNDFTIAASELKVA